MSGFNNHDRNGDDTDHFVLALENIERNIQRAIVLKKRGREGLARQSMVQAGRELFKLLL